MTAAAQGSVDSILQRTLVHLERLIGFDTTSRKSNLDLIAYVEAQLSELGVPARRIGPPDGVKANLLASLGPEAEGGVILSGHTDVVPVDGQAWTSDPFVLTRRSERLFGRGVSDMKSFLALSLAAAPLFQASAKRPAHLAFSYDEEIGCLGAPAMIERIAHEIPRAALAIVGEPTMMQVVAGHKGASMFRIAVRGREAHSSLPDLGASANMAAIELLSVLSDLSRRLKREARADSPFEPRHTTLTVGVIQGGTAGNILARDCAFVFDVRAVPWDDPETLLAPFYEAVERIDRDLKRKGDDLGVHVERLCAVPPLAQEADGEAERVARALTGDNGGARVVAYGAEAGMFQRAGISTVICGPGSIEQAHQADEFIDLTQLETGAAFMLRLAERLALD